MMNERHLDEIINEVLTKIRSHRPLYAQNETAVRDHIVNPILRTLGWNTENPDEVQPNMSTEDGIPDYSLFKEQRPVLFVEVKNLDTDVRREEVLRQLSRYCSGEGIEYGILTNGTRWVLFRAFERGKKLTERVVFDTDLERDPPLVVSKHLSRISKINVDQIEMHIRKAEALDNILASILNNPAKAAKSLVPLIKDELAKNYPDFQIDDLEIESTTAESLRNIGVGGGLQLQAELTPEDRDESSITREEKPQRMRLGRESFSVQNSFEILVNTANWLIKNGKLKITNCPVPAGPKRYLINKTPQHKHGAFRAPKKLVNGIYIETHYSTTNCISNARKLLKHCGLPENTLVVE